MADITLCDSRHTLTCGQNHMEGKKKVDPGGRPPLVLAAENISHYRTEKRPQRPHPHKGYLPRCKISWRNTLHSCYLPVLQTFSPDQTVLQTYFTIWSLHNTKIGRKEIADLMQTSNRMTSIANLQ